MVVVEEQPVPRTSLTFFITPKSTMTKRFHNYVGRLQLMAQLVGFLLDEAHVILDGTRDFQPKLEAKGTKSASTVWGLNGISHSNITIKNGKRVL